MTLISSITSTQWTFSIKGKGAIVQGLDSIKQCVYLILTTEPGTDPLRLDFGCGVIQYIDKPTTLAIPKMIKEISSSLYKWEPRIENIKVSQVEKIEQTTFKVSYSIKNTVLTDQLNITYA